MTDLGGSYISPFAAYGCWKVMKDAARVLTVPNSQDSAVLDNDAYLTLKQKVWFRRWTAIAEGDARTPSGLVECESW